jgi:hypothetical protein
MRLFVPGDRKRKSHYEICKLLLEKNVIIPVDGLIGLLLKAQGRWALAPDDDHRLFLQNRDIPSYILNDEKSLRQE